MKILIISLPRCGSTNLMKKISKENNLKSVFEPFDGSGREYYNINLDDIVVKTIVGHQAYSGPMEHFYQYHLDFLTNLARQFDEVILLSRKDLVSCAQSHAYVVYNKSRRNFSSTSEYLWEPTPVYELCLKNIETWNLTLVNLSEILKIPITYYEDIYDVNSSERLRKGNKLDSKISLL